MADANQVNDGQEDAATHVPQDDAAEVASPQKKRRIRVILLVVAAIAIIGGVFWYARYKSVGQYMQSTNDAFIQADAVTVAPKVSGYVDKVFVGENQDVKAGQPLLQIDTRDYSAQTAQIQAQIGVARANAEGVQAQIREQQAAIDRARAELRAAQSDAAFAQAEVTRYTPLAASGAESRERLSQLQNQARQANARVASASAALAAAQRRVGTLNAQVQQARSQGQAAKAQLDAAEVNLGSTLIRASIAGRVGNKTVRVGQFVQAGTRTMSIVPVSQLYIEANFKETQLGLMRPGQPVKIEVDALPDVEIKGHVESVAPGTGAQFSLLPPQNATGNFTKIVQRVPVRIAVDADPQTRSLLVPGMSVEVVVDTRSAKGALKRIAEQQDQHNEAREGAQGR
ncbi:hlyD secretion family protein [Sphingomonas sp. S17]|uniref:HlyD family secretion protein n=2 Tax=Sphingomonas paucimobilis TaxID=13689 RepID=A0A411LH53_SPHPI|nr:MULTISPECIES: HlyD family secretion protein [Sphingomonas]EGI56206.1 hlyD secretion family protein [Sphingomonas sp. S17]MBQ1478741.1 HlyD family secretion protein [Sphingomonas sp.]MCM3677784.1 HlyD family secretion protein [Sphingomonas paucimobilis]MDG5972413.1 HlyD family secretion protein [Sphingomonas paucimobilis]NNG57611.1 HlyD family secretion protein [Sphingomonas paucimobilis]